MKKAPLKNSLYKSIFGIILLLALTLLGAYSNFSNVYAEPKTLSSTEQILEKSVHENSINQEKTLLVPISKEKSMLSHKSGVFRFLLAMLGVFVSSFVIFICLKLYKQITLSASIKEKSGNFKETLESPKDFKHAINIFLHKTDK